MPKRKAKKAKKLPRNARRPDPTAKQYAQRIAEIQAGWSDATREARWQAKKRSTVPGILREVLPDRHRRGTLPADEPWWKDGEDE